MAINRTPFGGIRGGADLTGDAQLFTLHTVIDIEGGDFGTQDNPQRNLLRIAQVIQNKSVINYIKVTEESVDLSVAANRAKYGLGDNYDQASTVVRTLRFVTEQPGFAEVNTLLSELNGIDMQFETTGVPANGGPVNINTIDTDDASNNKNLSLSVEDFAG